MRFPLAFRGYRMSDVDELLARLASELEDRHRADGPGPGAASSGEPPRV